MKQPLVVALMLTRNRPAMAQRALKSFHSQTYENKHLLIWDTSDAENRSFDGLTRVDDDVDATIFIRTHLPEVSIGTLRNSALQMVGGADIVVHWDDDDYSHQDRIAEQVAFLQSTGADCVGYREMLFWRTRVMVDDRAMPDAYGEAWTYTNQRRDYILGTSLCYKYSAWKRKPFADRAQPHNPEVLTGEDYAWIQNLRVESTTSMRGGHCSGEFQYGEPKMIASIHSGNTSPAYDIEAAVAKGATEWRRSAAWDKYCSERMKL